MSADLVSLSLREAGAGIAAKAISSRELVEASLARIAATDREVGAFLAVAAERARSAAAEADARAARGERRSEIDGVPVAVKDIFATKGLATTAGSRILEGFVPPYDATVVERLEAAGAVLVGKLNMDEFAMGSSNENSAYRPCANPWDLTRTPGGSSGGSAAAVAARQVHGSLGTDTGGSIRLPAAFCGVVGVKPTYGRVSRYGVVAFASSLDQVGPLARTVEDAALLLGRIAGHDPRDMTSSTRPVDDYLALLEDGARGLRVGVPREWFQGGVDPGVERSVRAALATYERIGATLVEISLPHTRYGIAAYYLIAPSEASSNLARYDGVRYGLRVDGDTTEAMMAATRSAGFGPEVVRRIMIGTYALSAGYYDAYYVSAQRVRTLIIRDYEAAFERCDVVLSPTSPSTAFEIGAKTDDPLAMYLNDVFTVPASLAGMPALSMPAGLDDSGLPVGVQLVAPLLDEAVLFRAARALEAELAFDPVPRGANALHAPAAVRAKT